ncbi:blue-light-activated histidine kinase 2 [Variibacter gotjawalensis]|uniref:histidine kinase n=1 Tax=Variibacter gotjawalensis TaxID=1333996 RepID=A0A0S3PR32_9BRAD|nr:CHASE3 domain-containing protein [Variibacter gotjawalensis]NIK48696.1 two-component sensor histidine kinase [Variibacter gotjawalensis]RZS50557.1 two-component sensor histidine kinase [Variibacter gotjawalensis]BAT58391.1 blue-light-activated histidine kinase 2 [Variibacter gotjawalensis]
MPITARFVVQSTIVFLTVGFLALLGVVGTTIWLSERAQIYQDVSAHERNIRVAAVELRNALLSAESAQRGYLVNGNEIYLAPFDSARAAAELQLARLKDLLRGREETAAMLVRLSNLMTEKFDELNRTTQAKRDFNETEALTIFRTNRGKQLSDEANLFLSAIIRMADERLAAGMAEQTANATWLRLVSILGGVVIVGVVAGTMITVLRYAAEVAQARDEVRLLNANLEHRVERRTADLSRARDHAQALVAEVNHRVANSLALVSGFVRLQANTIKDPALKAALGETDSRILAVAAVHQRLYSSPDVKTVDLDEYLTAVLTNLETTMRAEGHGAALQLDLAPLKLRTDATVNLGIIAAEWVINAFKYAYPTRGGPVRVKLSAPTAGRAELTVEDDGVGRADGVVQGTGLGSRIVNAMAKTMGADVAYFPGNPGTRAQLSFALQE